MVFCTGQEMPPPEDALDTFIAIDNALNDVDSGIRSATCVWASYSTYWTSNNVVFELFA